MRRLIGLLIAVILVHACYRTGTVYWKYYQFRDAVQETAQFARSTSTVSTLQARVLEIASTMEIPLAADQIAVRQEENHTFIDAAYTDRIEVFPNYFYPRLFKVNVDAFRPQY